MYRLFQSRRTRRRLLSGYPGRNSHPGHRKYAAFIKHGHPRHVCRMGILEMATGAAMSRKYITVTAHHQKGNEEEGFIHLREPL